MKPVCTMLALLCAIPQHLASEESLGRIRAFLNGEELIWHTIVMEQGGKGVATAGFEQTAHYADLYIQGHLEPRFVSKGMLSVEVRYSGQFDPTDEPMAVEIIYMPNGLGGQFFTTRGSEPPQFEIIDFDAWGGRGTIIAAFSGELCAAWMNRRRDPTDCRMISGQVTSRMFVE